MGTTVYVDLETTGLDKYSDNIIQYAFMAVGSDGSVKEESSYVYTQKQIHPMATKAHMITNDKLEELRRSGQTVTQSVAVNNIIKFLIPLERPITLVGYNGLDCDVPFIFSTIYRQKLNARKLIDMLNISAFLDPFIYIKYKLTDEQKQKLGFLRLKSGRFDHQQKSIYRSLTGKLLMNAHDALADTKALKEISCHPSIEKGMNTEEESDYYKKYDTFMEKYMNEREAARLRSHRKAKRAIEQMIPTKQLVTKRKMPASDEREPKKARLISPKDESEDK